MPNSWPNTVWKFHDFSITYILREINFEDCVSAKSAISTHLEAMNFVLLHYLKAEIDQMKTIHRLKNDKNGRFCTSRIPKIDFT